VFPSLAALAAVDDLDGFKERLSGAMRGVLLLALPAMVGLIVLGQPVIAVLFQRGEWTAESTAGTAWALGFFALGLAGHSLLEVLSRAFYALSDTKTPVLVGIASMLANIALSLILIRVMGDPVSLARGPFAGLALANSVTTLLEALALWWLVRRRIGSQGTVRGINDAYVLDGAGRALAASLGMGVALWLAVRAFDGAGPLATTIIGGAVGGAAFFGLALMLRLDEARVVPNLLLRRVRR
jgi:putative peptidoglycan lipid II flippase